MRIDVIDLRDFYERPLGDMVLRVVRRQLLSIWPSVQGLDLAGLGYASPYLDVYRGQAQRILNFMPAAQGVSRWPTEGASSTALVDEVSLPLPDAFVDRLILVHCLENSEAVQPLLREIWRVLSPSGRLLIVTPNRRGLWACVDRTPFGHGRPYSRGQLTQLMRDAMFTPIRWSRSLYAPPFGFGLMMRSAAAWESVGARLWPRFSGILMLEASKQIYAVSAEPRRLRVLRPVPATPATPMVGGKLEKR